jgi:hypothetical protein
MGYRFAVAPVVSWAATAARLLRVYASWLNERSRGARSSSTPAGPRTSRRDHATGTAPPVQPLLDCEVARLLAATSGVQALDDPLALSHFGGSATTRKRDNEVDGSNWDSDSS